jgi:cytochrome c-type biogenesis protein CcmH/NrfG
MMMLAVPGVVAVVVTVLAFAITTSSDNSGNSDRTYLRRLALVALCLLICMIPAALFHVTRYGSSILHNIGTTALRSIQADPFTTSPDVSVAALESALRFDPTNAPLRLHLVQALTASLVTNDTPESRAQVVAELETLFRIQPYFVNGLEWRNFARNYKPLLGTESKP